MIKMDLKDIQWEGVDWIDLAQDRDRWWVLWVWCTTFGFCTKWGIFD